MGSFELATPLAIKAELEKLPIPDGPNEGGLITWYPWREYLAHRLAMSKQCRIFEDRFVGKTSTLAALAYCAIHPAGLFTKPGGKVLMGFHAQSGVEIAMEFLRYYLRGDCFDDDGKVMDSSVGKWRVIQNTHRVSIMHRDSDAEVELKTFGAWDEARKRETRGEPSITPWLALLDEPGSLSQALYGRFYHELCMHMDVHNKPRIVEIGTL